MNKSVYRGIMIGVMTGYGCSPIGLFLDKVLAKLFVKTQGHSSTSKKFLMSGHDEGWLYASSTVS